jgi:Tol biopolymer transport system component
LNTGGTQVIVAEDRVVKARWAPGGGALAYLLATDTTYELWWRSVSGEERLLASDASFIFDFSPRGDEIAFTREPHMTLDPNSVNALYVVTVAGGAERKIADIDTSGGGAFDDQPVWSPDGRYMLLPVSSATGGPRGLLRVAADGSSSAVLSFDPSLEGQPGYEDPAMIARNWHPDGQHLVGTAMTGIPMVGDARWFVVEYELDPTLSRIVAVTIIAADTEMVGWDMPGQSVWVIPSEGQGAQSGTVPYVAPMP